MGFFDQLRAAVQLIFNDNLPRSNVVVRTQSGVVRPTISVGVAVAENGECDPLALVARADAALYKAQHAGRNRFVVDQSDVRVAS